MPPFARICDVDLLKPQSWKNRVFLTLDIDWAHDTVLCDSIDLIEQAGMAATWFVTHETPLLSRLRTNPKFELGIHPNFNFLLQGDKSIGRNAEEVVDSLMEIVPEAKSVRSHSVTQNSVILSLFVERGLTYDCNHFIPEQSGIELKPWRMWNNMIKVPYFWEDDVAFISDGNTPIDGLIKLRDGLRVFDFHPIHIFLNTEHMERYESTRPWHQNPDELIKYRGNHLNGTRELLKQLLQAEA